MLHAQVVLDDTVFAICNYNHQQMPNFSELSYVAEKNKVHYVSIDYTSYSVPDMSKGEYIMRVDFPFLTVNVFTLFYLLKYKNNLAKNGFIKKKEITNVYYYNFEDVKTSPKYIFTFNNTEEYLRTPFGELIVTVPEGIKTGVYVNSEGLDYNYQPAVVINKSKYAWIIMFTNDLEPIKVVKYFGGLYGYSYVHLDETTLDEIKIPFLTTKEILPYLKEYAKPIVEKLESLS